jgi:hypothetical protein
MKKFIKKNWSIIGLIVAFMVNNAFQILETSGLNHTQIELVKGLGAVISGYYWTTKYNEKIINK